MTVFFVWPCTSLRRQHSRSFQCYFN